MIECPDCGKEIHGKKCACGYVVKSSYKSSGQSSVQCAAHGCPMPGSISSSTHPGDNTEWVCRFHFNKPVRDWPEITTKVRAKSKEDLFPSLPYQPGRVDVKKLNFANPGKDWANEVLALQGHGMYWNDYGVALAKAALRIQDKEAA